jgi:AcrR family transcriptional regulator
MSPRPRTVHDDAILDAAIDVLSRLGSERMTLADVGAQVGLSAATLVQRFGSKRELMLALLRHVIGNIEARFETAIANHTSPLDALYAAAADRAGPLDGHVTLAHRLAFYLSELDDPEFHSVAKENHRRAVEGFKRLIDNAVDAGELADGYTDSAQLADAIYTMQMGSLVNWAVTSEGTLNAKIRRELDVLLRPFRRGPRKANSNTTTRTPAKNSESMAAQPPQR